MQQGAVNILFYCSLTQHVSGALAPIIGSTGNCIYSHRYRVYTDKIKVVTDKTVKTLKNITLNLRLPRASVACHMGLGIEEEACEVLHLEHSFIWC
jgi:hypothetical protein